MTNQSCTTKTRRECRPLLRQALNTATLRHYHSLQQPIHKDPAPLEQGKHSVAEQATASMPAKLSGQTPGHGLQVRKQKRDDVIGSGKLGLLSDAPAITPSDPRFGAVGSGRRLGDDRTGRVAGGVRMQQICKVERVSADIGSRRVREEISEGTRIEEIRLAVRLVEDSARQLGVLKQSCFGKHGSEIGLRGLVRYKWSA